MQDNAVATSLSEKVTEMYMKVKNNAYEKVKCFTSYTI